MRQSVSVAVLLLGACVVFLPLTPAAGQSEHSPPSAGEFSNPIPPTRETQRPLLDYGGLEPGYGREETMYACDACHSLRKIRDQRLSLEQWDAKLIQLAGKVNGFPDLDADEREIILDYLSNHYGPANP